MVPFLMALSSSALANVDDVAIVGATIVDVTDAGRSSHDRTNATIVIRNGKIAEIGSRGQVRLPAGAHVIDATDKYAVPGLIDGFGSLRSQNFADAYLYEGVTTVYVIQAPPGSDGEATVVEPQGGPRLFRGATIGGYAIDGSVPATTPWTDYRAHGRRLSDAALVRRVNDLADHGVRGLLVGLDVWPDQLAMILGAARRRHLASSGEFAFTSYPAAVRAGIGSLLRNDHYLTALAVPEVLLAYADDPTGKGAGPAYRAACDAAFDSAPVSNLSAGLVHAHTALMPILSIEATADDVGAPNPWLSRSSKFVKPGDLDDAVDPKTGARPYLDSHLQRRQALQACAIHRQEIDRHLHAAGVIYLAGSGAPAYGILPGGGLHQELRLLQHVGLTPREALAAATGNYAQVYGWTDVGLIETGRVGDVLVVARDPRTDVAALDDIDALVQDGRVVDRDALLSRVDGAGLGSK